MHKEQIENDNLILVVIDAENLASSKALVAAGFDPKIIVVINTDEKVIEAAKDAWSYTL